MSRKDISDWMVVKAYHEAHGNYSIWPETLLGEWTGEPLKVCYAAMERAMQHGLIEYGVTLRAGWLTPKGKAVLEQIGARP